MLNNNCFRNPFLLTLEKGGNKSIIANYHFLLYHICMEKLIFSNKYLKTEYSFSDPINQLVDKQLVKILKKENYRNEDSGLFVSSSKNVPVSDLIQVKINVSRIGIFLVNFDKEKFNEEDKKKLIDEITKFKSEGPTSDEEQFKKIKLLVKVLNNANPLFITFNNNQQISIEEEVFKDITKDIKLTTYIFLLSKPKTYKAKEVKNNKVKEVKMVEIISFRDYMSDNIFFSIFCFIMSLSLIIGTVMSQNKDNLSIFLFVLCGIFFCVFSYSIYKYIGCFKEWSLNFQKTKFPVLMSFIGTASGIAIGFLISYFVIKPKEGISINYKNSLSISIPVGLGLTLLGLIMGYVIYIAIKHINKKEK